MTFENHLLRTHGMLMMPLKQNYPLRLSYNERDLAFGFGTVQSPGQRNGRGSASRPPVAFGGNTYRKARGGMSLASGYLTPTSQRTLNIEEEEEDEDTLVGDSPNSRIPPSEMSHGTLKTEYVSNKKHHSMYTPSTMAVSRATSQRSPTKRVFSK